MDIPTTLDTLIDRWCERRAIRPLQLLLRAYPGPLVHTDQMFELLEARDAEICTTLRSMKSPALGFYGY
ncbi:MAG: hypothetical protein ACREIC_18675 [Limisphaerales bacterium]